MGLGPEAMPIVRVELLSMRQAMMHAFTGQLDEIQAAADKAMEEALDARNIDRELKRLCEETLDREIKCLVAQVVHDVIWEEPFQEKLRGAIRDVLGKIKVAE